MDAGIVPMWQPLCLSALLCFVAAASLSGLTRKLRSVAQPWVSRRVQSDIPLILLVQRWHHKYFDNFFSALSCVVSVPFYTGFIPLLFWSGHSRLARQITLLMAFCDYIGNAVKDAVSAPRPSSPPVRRVTATEDEKENALEYGLPSSHALNTVCLSGYLLHYVITTYEMNCFSVLIGFSLVFLLVSLIGIGRIYLGMHSFIDVVAGIVMGLVILSFWLSVHRHVDGFITEGQNVTSFWAGLSFVLLFAYPTPGAPTPSFEYHTSFTGVLFGILSGVQQTYHTFHSDDVPHLFSSTGLSWLVFSGRMLAGIPTILIVKFCSKAIAKRLLPVICNTLGIPIMSSCYVPALKESVDGCKNRNDGKQIGCLQKAISFLPQKTFDVDTGIRFLQYAGLGWSVSDLVPYLFTRLNLQ